MEYFSNEFPLGLAFVAWTGCSDSEETATSYFVVTWDFLFYIKLNLDFV